MSNWVAAVFNTVVAVMVDPPKIVELVCKPMIYEITCQYGRPYCFIGRGTSRRLPFTAAADRHSREAVRPENRFDPFPEYSWKPSDGFGHGRIHHQRRDHQGGVRRDELRSDHAGARLARGGADRSPRKASAGAAAATHADHEGRHATGGRRNRWNDIVAGGDRELASGECHGDPSGAATRHHAWCGPDVRRTRRLAALA